MKATFIFLTSAFWFNSLNSLSQNPYTPIVYIGKLSTPYKSCVVIPSSFSNNEIIEVGNSKKIGSRKILHIELVYTRFKLNPSFDQNKLNEQRMNELKVILPQTVKDKPSWRWIEQTDAKTIDEAKEFFHGFVLYLEDSVKNNSYVGFLQDKGNENSCFIVTNSKGGTYHYESGTTIHVPANSVVNKNGKLVTGDFTLEYKEYRNPAEILFSGIPMVYKEGNSRYNFNSTGMFEMRAKQNGEELFLKNPITVDFNCTKQADQVSFFQLNDNTGEWLKIEPIRFKNQGNNPQLIRNEQKITKKEEVQIQFYKSGKDVTIMALNKAGWNQYLSSKKKDPAFFMDAIISENENVRELIIKSSFNDKVNKLLFVDIEELPGIKELFDLSVFSESGNVFPSLVQGLRTSSFGVYNCDQIYRIGNPALIHPTYIDDRTGKEINDSHVACLIDHEVNGSFSLDPKNIILNSNGRNSIILFTKDKRMYIVSPKDLSKVDFSGDQQILNMRDITSEVNTSDELMKFLSLNNN